MWRELLAREVVREGSAGHIATVELPHSRGIIVRQISFAFDGRSAVCVCDNGTVWRIGL